MDIELLVIASMRNNLRCLRLPERQPTILRPSGGVREEVEGEILKVAVSKEWTYATHRYVSGRIVDSRIDGSILSPVPLRLYEQYEWDPEDEFVPSWEEELDSAREGGPPPEWVTDVIRSGRRTAYEMEQVLPWDVIPGRRGSPEDPDSDPIVYAVERYHGCDAQTAFDILQKCLQVDTRCIDAYVHLGNYRAGDMKWRWLVEQGAKCYQAAVAVGERVLPQGFDGVLPWGMIDNRPFLRGLHGLAICLWNLGDVATARLIFQRILRLNPADNQGVRFLLPALDSGMSHLEYCRQEEERGW